MALLKISESQLKLGDRAAGLRTLDQASALIDQSDTRKDDWNLMTYMCMIARAQRDAGELAAARNTLDRLTRVVESLKPAKVEEVIVLAGKEEKLEVGAFMPAEMGLELAAQRLELGDKEEAIRLTHRATVTLRSANGFIKVAGLSLAATTLHCAGAAEEALTLINEADRTAREQADPAKREFIQCQLARSLSEVGSIEAAMKVVESLAGPGRLKALEEMIESLGEDESQNVWLDMSGMKILIGAGWLKLKDPAAARKVLPRIALAVLALGDPLVTGRALSRRRIFRLEWATFQARWQRPTRCPT